MGYHGGDNEYDDSVDALRRPDFTIENGHRVYRLHVPEDTSPQPVLTTRTYYGVQRVVRLEVGSFGIPKIKSKP